MSLWRNIFDSIPSAIVVLDSECRPLAHNSAAETILGAAHVNAVLIDELRRRNPWFRQMVDSCLDGGQTFRTRETVMAVGQRTATVSAEVAPMVDSEGRAEAVIIVLRDPSRQRVTDYAFDTGAVGLPLSSAGLAHEVKNPLTGIKGAAELLAAMLPSETRAQQYCSIILDGVSRIAALVEQVLMVDSPQRLNPTPVNIHQILHNALRLAGLYPQAPPGVNLQQEFDPSLPELSGDSASLERAFLNIIRNAAEAIGPTGTIRLRTRMESDFRVTAGGTRHQLLRIEISDSGPGMSDKDMEQLFTPFFTTKPAGTGLGLVLSQRIISLHGGRLWAERMGVDNTPGGDRARRGMTFKVTLPVVLRADESADI